MECICACSVCILHMRAVEAARTDARTHERRAEKLAAQLAGMQKVNVLILFGYGVFMCIKNAAFVSLCLFFC